MANPNGNPGNKGGGRPSLKKERRNLEAAQQMFFGKVDMEKIRQIAIKIRTGKGKVSVREVMLMKAVEGNERLIAELANKVMASKQALEVGKSVRELLNEQHDRSTRPPKPDRVTPAGGEQGTATGPVPAQPDSAGVQSPADKA